MECKIRDLNIHYEAFGSGRPILILHGAGVDHRLMTYHLEPLFKDRSGWRRLYPDLPGHGQTRASDWITHYDHVLEVVLEFMDALAPEERCVVLGASYGGFLARGVLYRRQAQLDGVALIVPAVKSGSGNMRLPAFRVVHEDPQFIAALQPDEQGYRNWIVAQSPGMIEEIRTIIAPSAARTDNKLWQRMPKDLSFSFDVDALPMPFPAPALIMTGRQDNITGYQNAWDLLDNYPRGTYVVLDRAGHALPTEQKPLSNALIGEWLDRVEEYASQKAELSSVENPMQTG